MPEQDAEILPYPHHALPVELAGEISDILSTHGIGGAGLKPRACYQSLPSSPPGRRAGLEDIFLFSRGTDQCGKDADAPAESVPATGDVDGLLLVCFSLSIHVPPWLGTPDDATAHARMRATARNIVDSLNGRWVARGRIADARRENTPEYSRCLIHFAPNIEIEGEETANGPFAGVLVHEVTEASPVSCLIQLSRAAFPTTRWKTEDGEAELGTGSDFELDVPLSARAKLTVQNLKTRIDQYHRCNALLLSERISRIREIRTGARAFLELGGEVCEDWAVDTALSPGEYPAEKQEIEAKIQYCREARDGELAERLEHLNDLRACCVRYRPGDTLKRGWRASRFTLDIDSALIAYEDLPPTSYRERIGALGALQSQCEDFIARARQRNRFWHRHLHRLVPDVEVLALRARSTRGEIALSHGIAHLIEAIDAKTEELELLRATRALAARANAVKSNLEAQRNSLVLLVEYGDAEEPADALACALREHLPALFGIERTVDAIQAEDLLPLVRRVLVADAGVMPLV